MSPDQSAIQSFAVGRGISRLCHFTPIRNLLQIVNAPGGILPRVVLEKDETAWFAPTDSLRLDRHRGHTCCSVEYPNTYFLEKAIQNEPIFKDWAILEIDPSFIWSQGTLFSPCNAATAGGAYIRAGLDGFKSLYSDPSEGPRRWSRRGTHLLPVPTDMQAEVLVEQAIPLSAIRAIIVRNTEQVALNAVRIRLSGANQHRFKFKVAGALFTATQLRDDVWAGRRPSETSWEVPRAG